MKPSRLRDRMTVVASGLGFPESPLVLPDGSILVSEVSEGRLTRLVDGQHETYAEVRGGPNGLLLLGGDVVVCQNGGSSWAELPWPLDLPGSVRLRRPAGPPRDPVIPCLQRVAPDGAVTEWVVEFTAQDGRRRRLSRPSDICPDGAGGFYLTDGGATADRRRDLTGLLHGTPDGTVTEVVYPLEMPNGVAISPDATQLYLAETRTRRIWCFDVRRPGVVAGARGFATVPSGGPLNFGGADGVCVDPSGCVVVATLGTGGVTVFSPDGELLFQVPADDRMTTNVAVDVAADRLLMSLASTGRLVAVEGWSALLRAALAAVPERR